jgi:hypothetical protein
MEQTKMRWTVLLWVLVFISCQPAYSGETIIVCDRGKYANTCLDEGKTITIRRYVEENSKYKKIVDTKTTGKYNQRKIEIHVKEK